VSSSSNTPVVTVCRLLSYPPSRRLTKRLNTLRPSESELQAIVVNLFREWFARRVHQIVSQRFPECHVECVSDPILHTAPLGFRDGELLVDALQCGVDGILRRVDQCVVWHGDDECMLLVQQACLLKYGWCGWGVDVFNDCGV
jgi:hypothetical protein